jgi:hypothetical protein
MAVLSNERAAGTFFAVTLSLTCYRILSSIFRGDASESVQPAATRQKQKKKNAPVPVKEAVAAVEPQPHIPMQPQKPGVSLKQLMKQSQQAQSK